MELELPAAYEAADKKAERNRWFHERALWLQIVLGGLVPATTLVVSGSTWLPWPLWIPERVVAPIVLGFFGLALIVRGVSWAVGFERRWYQARGLAETLRQRAWMYAMRVRPYDGELAEQAYLRDCEGYSLQDRGIQAAVGDDARERHLPDAMVEFRNQELSVRVDGYLVHRVDNQLDYFVSRLGTARTARRCVNAVFMGATLMGLGGAIVLAFELGSLPENWLATCSAIGAGALAVGAMRRDTSVIATYGATEHRLQHLKTTFDLGNCSVGDLVDAAEEVLGAEARGWITKRLDPAPPLAPR